jgi:polyhydroxyalkanoate synthesis repressor PhaR
MEETETKKITIKKYANRRLYDTTNSKYVNLKQIAQLIKDGHIVEVVDATNKENLTKLILTQIILEEEKEQRNLLPNEFLHEIIKYGESAYSDFFKQFLNASMDAYKNAQQQMESAFRGWLPPSWPGFPQQPQSPQSASKPEEISELEARIAELEGKLAQKNSEDK